jgi:hypothetical protein
MDELKGSAGTLPADGSRFELRFRLAAGDFLILAFARAMAPMAV